MENKKNDYDQLKFLTERCFECLIKGIETRDNPSGAYVYFDMPDRDNMMGFIKINKRTDAAWWLQVSVNIGDTGYTISSYTSRCADIEELKAYLSDKNNVERVADIFVDLKESADSKAHEYPFY